METKKLVRTGLFAALTAVGAYLSIPIQPVPFTMQPFFVMLSGVVLGSAYGGLSQLIYVLIGIVGLPVFAGGASGIGIVLGPTGGFLIGFIVCAFMAGKLVEMRQNPGYWWIVFSMIIGLVFLYGIGVLRLSQVAHLSTAKAFMLGAAPYIPFDLIKAAIVGFVGLRLRKVLK